MIGVFGFYRWMPKASCKFQFQEFGLNLKLLKEFVIAYHTGFAQCDRTLPSWLGARTKAPACVGVRVGFWTSRFSFCQPRQTPGSLPTAPWQRGVDQEAVCVCPFLPTLPVHVHCVWLWKPRRGCGNGVDAFQAGAVISACSFLSLILSPCALLPYSHSSLLTAIQVSAICARQLQCGLFFAFDIYLFVK